VSEAPRASRHDLAARDVESPDCSAVTAPVPTKVYSHHPSGTTLIEGPVARWLGVAPAARTPVPVVAAVAGDDPQVEALPARMLFNALWRLWLDSRASSVQGLPGRLVGTPQTVQSFMDQHARNPLPKRRLQRSWS